ncbi:MAG: hypothetical protein KH092_04690 [Actinomyces sp.]|nr:hypothetical protein [Actinomyces sp.]
MAHSNFEFIALELQRFGGISKNDRYKLRAKCGWRWCRRPRVPQPGSVGQVARSPETGVAFACWHLYRVETAIAFAGAGRALHETAIAFAGAKKFALLGLMVGVSAKKFAQRRKNGPKLAFCGVLGELFRGNAAGRGVLGEFFRGNSAGEALLGEFFRDPAAVGSCWANFVAP